MTQMTSLGEAEVDAYVKARRAATGLFEYFHVVDGENIPLTAEEYSAATGEAV